MTGVFTGINTTLAVVAAAAAFGALNKMKVGETRPCVILAMLLIGLGLAGQALGLLWAQWAFYADTALYGGILALILASQRVHSWFLERWANPAATVIGVVIGALFIVGLLGGCAPAHAQERPTLDKPVLVVALDRLDANRLYARSVMVAVPWPAGGHVGFILNKPTKMTMGEVFQDHAPSQLVKDPVYLGGPTAVGVIFAMVRADPPPGARTVQVGPGVWLLIQSEQIDEQLERAPNEARYYAGYVSWKPGELAEEIRTGQMMLRPLDPARLFAPDSSTMYDELVTPNRKPPAET
jgi:putative transcriptional regulator